MVDLPNNKRGSSPLFLPKTSAAFKPFKKRSLSVADSSSSNVKGDEGIRKRDEKAERKLEETIKQT